MRCPNVLNVCIFTFLFSSFNFKLILQSISTRHVTVSVHRRRDSVRVRDRKNPLGILPIGNFGILVSSLQRGTFQAFLNYTECTHTFPKGHYECFT